MEFVYKNKKTNQEIFKKANKISKKVDIQDGVSCLIKADNFLGLSTLMKNDSIKGKVQLAYFDPPFNTNQIFTTCENRNNTISRSKNGKLAYSDKLSKEDYLEFIRERLIILKELMSDDGSIYLHIDYKIGHYIKIIMDEVFGEDCFKNDITRIKSNPKNFSRKAYGNEKDLILFYVKKPNKNIWNEIRENLSEKQLLKAFPKTDDNGRRYTTIPLHAPGETNGVTGSKWRNLMPPIRKALENKSKCI